MISSNSSDTSPNSSVVINTIHCKYCDSSPEEWTVELTQRGGKDIIKIACSRGHFIRWKTAKTEEEIKLSNIETQKKFKEKTDPEKYKKRRIEYQRKYYYKSQEKMTPEQKEEYLRKARERQRRYLQKKKLQKKKLLEDQHTTGDENI